MEHRCSIRKRLAIRVLFYKHGLPVQSGLSRDLGLGGVFVETRPWQWQKNECLEIEFIGSRGCKIRLRALVVHQREQGVGLMFDALDDAQRRGLRDILFDEDRMAAFVLSPPVENPGRQVA